MWAVFRDVAGGGTRGTCIALWRRTRLPHLKLTNPCTFLPDKPFPALVGAVPCSVKVRIINLQRCKCALSEFKLQFDTERRYGSRDEVSSEMTVSRCAILAGSGRRNPRVFLHFGGVRVGSTSMVCWLHRCRSSQISIRVKSWCSTEPTIRLCQTIRQLHSGMRCAKPKQIGSSSPMAARHIFTNWLMPERYATRRLQQTG